MPISGRQASSTWTLIAVAFLWLGQSSLIPYRYQTLQPHKRSQYEGPAVPRIIIDTDLSLWWG